ncbi:MAG: c-type cytochrome [Verrucomicrobia subdivision 3 bacterium]|nr:c-type cytochrome [Limisphaerales bacterium]
MRGLIVVYLLTISIFLVAADKPKEKFGDSLKPFVENFKGRGALTDGSMPSTPAEGIKKLKMAEGLAMQVVAHEPAVAQPLNMYFDERGRMWVTQYLQYPFPAGIKILEYDKYLRAVYDKVPPPPPNHFRGKDKITIHEDTNGDGVFDKHKTFLDGLNMARSVITGRGGAWVLMPPYLLYYPDKNGDDIPDGDPTVHLTGFGLEDTHSGANSLRWGPDGWIYGAHGSTCTAEIQGIKFLGQAIWRYHPPTKRFEVFAEGGGNTYCLDFDRNGRTLSGTNYGNTRGVHYVQGGCYIKGWAKHGPLINPHAFGFYKHMAHEGYTKRFPQSMIVYEGGALPGYEGNIISGMSLVNRVQASRLYPDNSTFRTVDTPPMVTTEDRWFRIVDTKAGPDGAVYFADWYDSRLSHLDPRDTWHKSSGRIYRMHAKDAKPSKPFDYSKLSTTELLNLLGHPNKWHRQTAQRLIADRRNASIVPDLTREFMNFKGQGALEIFWAINHSGGFTPKFAEKTLTHANPFVRFWTIRLLGDSHTMTPTLRAKLIALAKTETHAEVRSCLAASCKRWVAKDSFPILAALIHRNEDVNDKHIPLLIWWALENKAVSGSGDLTRLLTDKSIWAAPMTQTHLIKRLGQRFTAEPTSANLKTAARLLALAPTAADRTKFAVGMEEGLRGNSVQNPPKALLAETSKLWNASKHTPTLISLATRLGLPEAMGEAIALVKNPKTSASERRALTKLLSERRSDSALDLLLSQFKTEKTSSRRIELMTALQRFEHDSVGTVLLARYAEMPQRERESAQNILSSRANWSLEFITAIDAGKIKREDVRPATVLAMQSHKQKTIAALVKKHWGQLRQSTEAKQQRMQSVAALIAENQGDAEAGKLVFAIACAACHRLRGQGGNIGPSLDAYQLNNPGFLIPAVVDPSLGIREEYAGFNVVTKDNQRLTGFIAQTAPKFIVLRDLAQNSITLPRKEIKDLQAMPVSLMPEGLLDTLTPQQVRDLFAFLMAK